MRPGRRTRRGVVAASVLVVALAGLAAPGTAPATAAVGEPGPFVTFMFSRTEITAADACRPADTASPAWTRSSRPTWRPADTRESAPW